MCSHLTLRGAAFPQLHRPLRTLIRDLFRKPGRLWTHGWCVYLCVYGSDCLCLYVSFYVCLSVCQSLSVSVCLFVWVYVWVCVYMSFNMCLMGGVCVCVCNWVSRHAFVCVCTCPCALVGASPGVTLRGGGLLAHGNLPVMGSKHCWPVRISFVVGVVHSPHQTSPGCYSSPTPSWQEKEEGVCWRRVTPGNVWELCLFTHQRHYCCPHFTDVEIEELGDSVHDPGHSPANEWHRRGLKLSRLARLWPPNCGRGSGSFQWPEYLEIPSEVTVLEESGLLFV